MADKVLVVDDEQNFANLIQLVLIRAGYQADIARNGREALAKVQADKPDLVILDVMMPGMSGLEVCQALRENPETAAIPVIMLSALTQLADKIGGLQVGADDYVAKTADLAEIVARVAALLSRSRRPAAAAPVKRGKILGFIGAKGGVGTSTVALSVAAILVQQKKTVIALELRPYYGSFASQLKWTPVDYLTRLLELEPADLDERALNARLFSTPAGMKVLFGPQKLTDYRELSGPWVEALLRRAALMADYVVLDLPCCPSAANQAAARACDLVALVLESESSCINAAKASLGLLSSWGVVGNLVGAVIVNRGASAMAVSLREIKGELGCEILGVMPAAGDACIAAVNSGVPLPLSSPNHMATSTLVEMTNRLMTDATVGIRL